MNYKYQAIRLSSPRDEFSESSLLDTRDEAEEYILTHGLCESCKQQIKDKGYYTSSFSYTDPISLQVIEVDSEWQEVEAPSWTPCGAEWLIEQVRGK